MKLLDQNIKGNYTEELKTKLFSKIVGQEEPIEAICEYYQLYKTGLIPTTRPIANLLLTGPTGTGKTRLVEAFAESVFGTDRAFIKIDCGEFQHSHEISKLVGSPPGYLGHKETHPVLSESKIKQHQTDQNKFTIVLFDEIEKASDSLWNLLLGILDKGTLTTGDNTLVDMSSCFILMTSNIGAQRLAQLKAKKDIGYTQKDKFTTVKDMRNFSLAEVKKKFTPEFINRLDKIIYFRELTDDDYKQILDIEIQMLQDIIMVKTKQNIFVEFSESCKENILKKGISKEYGARDLKRIIDKSVKISISNLIASKQIEQFDIVKVDYENDDFRYYKVEAEDLM